MKLNHEIVKNKNPETIRVMLAYKNHHSVDLLIRNCMLLCNEKQYEEFQEEIHTRDTRLRRSLSGRMRSISSGSGSRSKSPYHTNVYRTKPRPKSSILTRTEHINRTQKVSRKGGSPLRQKSPREVKFHPNASSKRSNMVFSARDDILEIRDILCIKNPGQEGYQHFNDIVRKVYDSVEED